MNTVHDSVKIGQSLKRSRELLCAKLERLRLQALAAHDGSLANVLDDMRADAWAANTAEMRDMLPTWWHYALQAEEHFGPLQ